MRTLVPPISQQAQPEPAQTVRKPAAPARPDGLPERLRAGAEALSGISLADVKVHHNSSEPEKLGALAFARGNDIFLGPGQERHLPHETWHVVQQKQGRVAATIQEVGTCINNDHGLEREADLFNVGFAAGFGRLPHPPRVSARSAPGSIVAQRKLVVGSRPVEDREVAHSDVLSRMNNLGGLFILRDDWTKDSAEDKTHVLDGSRKYLCGEDHRYSTFLSEAGLWKDVPKLLENFNEIPGREGSYERQPDKSWRPLESTHVHMLTAALLVNNYLNDLLQNGRPAIQRATHLDILGFVKHMIALATQYRKYADDSALIYVTPKQDVIVAFANALDNSYLAELEKLHDALLFIQGSKSASDDHMRWLSVAYREEFRTARAAIRAIVATMLDIMQIPTQSEESQQLAELAGDWPHSEGETLKAGLERRDEEMAQRINAAEKPALVALGDAHVEGVAKLVRDAVPIHWPKKLTDATSLANWIMLRQAIAPLLDPPAGAPASSK